VLMLLTLILKSKSPSAVLSMTPRPRTSRDVVLLMSKNAIQLMRKSVRLGLRLYATLLSFKSALHRTRGSVARATRDSAVFVPSNNVQLCTSRSVKLNMINSARQPSNSSAQPRMTSNARQFMSKNVGRIMSRNVQRCMNKSAPLLTSSSVLL